MNTILRITTIAIDPEDEEIKYEYSVSAGKVIGEGADIEWDLSDVQPGTYSVTAGISQPSIFGKNGWAVFGMTQTRKVIVKECPDCK